MNILPWCCIITSTAPQLRGAFYFLRRKKDNILRYITTGATTTIADQANGILIQVNAALTGTITVTDGGVTKGIITNPTVGLQFRYYGFTGAVALVTSTTCDITVSVLNTTR